VDFVHFASQSYSNGFSLHAATRIEAGDRAGLERLYRFQPTFSLGKSAM
jgi:hypothetical protein